jgi:hypothetical protein
VRPCPRPLLCARLSSSPARSPGEKGRRLPVSGELDRADLRDSRACSRPPAQLSLRLGPRLRPLRRAGEEEGRELMIPAASSARPPVWETRTGEEIRMNRRVAGALSGAQEALPERSFPTPSQRGPK